jgi:hypothetical protein
MSNDRTPELDGPLVTITALLDGEPVADPGSENAHEEEARRDRTMDILLRAWKLHLKSKRLAHNRNSGSVRLAQVSPTDADVPSGETERPAEADDGSHATAQICGILAGCACPPAPI